MSNKAKATDRKEDGKPALLPKQRFPEFREAEEWKKMPVGSFIEEFRAKSTIQDEYEVMTSARTGLVRQRDYYDNDRIAGRDNIGFNIIPPNYLTYRSRSDDRQFYFNENSIGITGIVSVYYPVFRIINGSNKFFIELLSYFSDVVGKHSVGTSQTVLSLNQLRRIKLAIPGKAEQLRIAECLSSVDELIAAQARKVDALKTHKKGLMQQLFPREGETQPRLRFPEFQDAGEWDVRNLGKVAENVDNRRVPITSSERVAGDVPYYGASGVVDYVKGFIFDEDLLCVSEDGANLVARTYPIAFPISGKTWVNNHAHVLRFKNACTQKFVEVYLNSIKLDDFITGMAQPKLNKAMLDGIPIPYPDVSEQQRIADCLTTLDDLIAAQTQKIEALKAHKKGLTQQLFPSLDKVQE